MTGPGAALENALIARNWEQALEIAQLMGLSGSALAAALAAAKAKDKTKPCPTDTTDDCEQEWIDAYDICTKELSSPNPSRGITGGHTNVYDCARGLVSQRCGGNAVTL